MSGETNAHESDNVAGQLAEQLADLVQLVGFIPRLANADEIQILHGGLTNRNVKVVTADGAFVVRVSKPDSSLLAIDRDNEEHNTRVAAAVGVGPAVFERVVDPPMLVVEFLAGETLSSATIAEPQRVPRIAAALRSLHAGPPFAREFDMFSITRHYLDVVRSNGWDLPDGYDERWATFAAIEAALRVDPEPLVPCHNDLLAENLLDTGDVVRLIDFEYSGNNEASFEVGNLASESEFTDDETARLVAEYWGDDDPRLVARAKLWGYAAKFGWTLWGVISGNINDADFDFTAWAMQRYDPFCEASDNGQIAALIAALRP